MTAQPQPHHDVILAAGVVLSALRAAPEPVKRWQLVEEISRVHPSWSPATCSRRFRDARALLVREGHPVMSDGAKGFRLATTREETAARSERLRKAGLAQLSEAARLARIPLGTMLRQAAFEFGDWP